MVRFWCKIVQKVTTYRLNEFKISNRNSLKVLLAVAKWSGSDVWILKSVINCPKMCWITTKKGHLLIRNWSFQSCSEKVLLCKVAFSISFVKARLIFCCWVGPFLLAYIQGPVWLRHYVFFVTLTLSTLNALSQNEVMRAKKHNPTGHNLIFPMDLTTLNKLSIKMSHIKIVTG